MVERATEIVNKWAALVALAMTGGTLIWQMSGIAHDVSEVRAGMVDMRAEKKSTDDRIYALEGRVVKIETSVADLKEHR